MTTDAREVLSALIDREPVDAGVLARVLDDPAARALLVDFVRLRALVNGPAIDALGSAVPARGRAGRTTPGRPSLRLAAAALVVFGALGGGFWLGEHLGRERPPAPTRVLQFTPGVDWHAGS